MPPIDEIMYHFQAIAGMMKQVPMTSGPLAVRGQWKINKECLLSASLPVVSLLPSTPQICTYIHAYGGSPGSNDTKFSASTRVSYPSWRPTCTHHSPRPRDSRHRER